jgi:ribosomal protein S18 acetylase RimI-like enzyme
MRNHATVTPTIRSALQADQPALERIISAVELFPADMLGGMMAAYLAAHGSADEFWLTDDDGGPVGVAYCAPERLTDGTWNLLMIAVHPDKQRQGRGAALIGAVERQVAARDGRIVLVETSGLGSFEGQRALYKRLGYAEEARIRDFYEPGNDKVVFWKSLARQA